MSTPWEIADQAQRMLREAEQARQQAAAMMARAERTRYDMTGLALWCSIGEHSFGQQDRKRTTFTFETFDDDGNPVTERGLMCGLCADKRRGAFRQPTPQTKAIPATDAQGRYIVDPDEYRRYMDYLEQQAGEQAGENPSLFAPRHP